MKKFLDDVPVYENDTEPLHKGAIFPIVIVLGMLIIILGSIWLIAQLFI